MISLSAGYLAGRDAIRPVHMDLARLRGGGCAPAQFDGQTQDGRAVYIRYRGGGLSMDLDGQQIAAGKIGPGLHGALSMGQACDILGLTINGTAPPLPPEGARAAEIWLDFSPNVQFYESFAYMTPTALNAFLGGLMAAWPDASLRSERLSDTVPRATEHVDVALRDAGELRLGLRNSCLFLGDQRARDAADAARDGNLFFHAMELGRKGACWAFRISYGGWSDHAGRNVTKSSANCAAETPADCPAHLPPEPAAELVLQACFRLDDAAGCARVAQLDTMLARQTQAAAFRRYRPGGPDNTARTSNFRVSRDMVDWCSRSQRHAFSARAAGFEVRWFHDRDGFSVAEPAPGQTRDWQWTRVEA